MSECVNKSGKEMEPPASRGPGTFEAPETTAVEDSSSAATSPAAVSTFQPAGSATSGTLAPVVSGSPGSATSTPTGSVESEPVASTSGLGGTQAPKRKFREIALECLKESGKYLVCNIVGNKCCYQQEKQRYDSGNFIRHFRVEHPDQAMARGLFKDEQQPVRSAKKRKVPKASVPIDKTTVWEALVELVTVHNLPLQAVEWKGFRKLLDPIGDALNMTINRTILTTRITEVSRLLKQQLAEELRDRLITVQIDSASRHGRHVLGINVGYFDGEKVIIRTLGMVEVKQRQTAKFIKDKIIELLQSYGVPWENVFSVTCDNGANMVAAVKEYQQKFMLEHSVLDSFDEDDSNTEDGMLEAVIDELKRSVSLIRCAVHTLQLSVTDVIKPNDEHIRAITSVVKNTRKTIYKNIFELHNASLSPLYSRTRWGGVYVMLEHIKSQEDFYRDLGKQYQELDLTDQWQFIDEYIEAFKPVYICTKIMQAAHVSLSDFYIHWLRTMMEVKTVSNQLATALVASLSSRLQSLMNNPAFKATLLVDPRFNYLNSKVMSAEEKEDTKRFIISTSERLAKLKSIPNLRNPGPETIGTPSNDLDDFMTNLFGGLPPGAGQETNTPLLKQLNDLDLEVHKSFSYDVWKHWLDRRQSHPQLAEVALLLLSVPSNQVSVERSFSAMALVLTDRRTKLSEETLENLLLIKLNSDLIEKIVPDICSVSDSV